MSCSEKRKGTSDEEHSQRENTAPWGKLWRLMYEYKSSIRTLAALSAIVGVGFTAYSVMFSNSDSVTKAEVTDSSETEVTVQNEINNSIDMGQLQSNSRQTADSSSERSGASSHVAKKFTVSGLKETSLIERIEELTAYIHDPSSKQNHVHLTRTGRIQKVSNGLYWYRGGYLKGMVDDRRCFVLREVTIPPTLREGNPRLSVKEYLRREVADAVAQNQTEVASNLTECFQ